MKRAAVLSLVLCIMPALLGAQVLAYDYSSLYELSKPAIVTITTDDGSASGFLVTSYGHIATNYHVIRNSRYLAVQFPDGRKVTAQVVAVNPQYDMALLKVNSSVVAGIRPLPVLSEDKENTVKVGIPVVALGSPFNQKFLMTQGILSKVDETVLLGDFLLQPGNSGGPLLNTEGDVIGMNTFGESNLSGAIRISMLREFLESPELVTESAEIEPSAELLRSVSSHYPIEVLNQKVEHESLDWAAYRLKAGDFTVTVITPVLIGKLQVMQQKLRATNRYERRTKNIPDPAFQGGGELFYDWHHATESSLDYAVTFAIRPDSGPTKGSGSSKIFPPFSLFSKKGKVELEFKAEFLDFRLYRDGVLIQPIMPGRAVIDGNSEKKTPFNDQAYAGSYIYSPDDFLTGNEFRIQIIDARKPDVIHKEVVLTPESPLIRQLRADFAFPTKVFVSDAH